MRKINKMHKPDWVFITLFAIVAIFGLIMLSSASTAIAFQRFADSLYYVKHQLFYGFIPGVFICIALALIDFHYWKRFAFTFFVFSIFLLLLVFIPGIGQTYGGSRSWISLGGLTFQPSEVVKLAFILYLAAWLEKRDKKVIKDFSAGFVPFLLSLGIVTLLIIMQPDVGTMGVIVVVALMMYFVAGAQIKHLLGLSAFGIGLLSLLIAIAPYRIRRFSAFLHPELHPQGIGYHINQALLAIGSGGLLGLGFGHSRQKHLYLPEVIGDSIFAVIAEELGFIVVMIFLFILLALIFRGYGIVRNSPDKFGMFVGAGIISWIGFQSFINIAAMVGIVPITGLPLPFISYGSSSLVVLFAAMGVMINISRQTLNNRQMNSRVIKRL